MLTPREQAAESFTVAVAQSRARVLGVSSMVDVTQERLVKIRRAERAIAGARGTERHYLREPDDARLDQMAEKVAQLVETFEDDGTRWAASS